MPKKSTRNPEAETLIVTPIDESEETPTPAKKTARKKAATKKSPGKAVSSKTKAVSAPSSSDPAIEKVPEAAAQAAETFDDAFEANGPAEARQHAVVTAAAQAAAVETSAADTSSSDDEDQEEPERAERPPAKLERLQKILAQAGVASRRHAEELITEGRVQVNGQVVTTLGSKADAARDHIRVDGKLLHGAERLRYFVLNKPRGYVTTVSDPEGRPTVMEFFSKMNERLYPVGRLDYLSEGLLLVTNDGELANKLTRAATGVEKTYLVKVSGQPTDEQLQTLTEGVSIEKGRPGEGRVRTAPARVREIRSGDNPWFEVVLIEGRNRELRKMFEEIGHFVEKIRRVGYGPLVLDLEPGQHRELDPEELHLLRQAAEGKWKPKRVKTTSMLPKEAGRTVDLEAARRGKKPYRAPRREDSRGGRPEFRPSGERPAAPRSDRPYSDRQGSGQRGSGSGERRPFQSGSTGGAGRQSWGQDRGARPAGRPAERRDQGGDNRSARGPARTEGRGSFARPPRPAFKRPEFDRPKFDRPQTDRPAEAGEQRRADSRMPGRGGQGQERGAQRGFKPAGERSSFGRGSDRRGPRPSFERGGERRDFARPPREDNQRGGKPEFRTERPRGERPAAPRGPAAPRSSAPSRNASGPRSQDRPSTGSRPPRLGGFAPRTGAPERRDFNRPPRPSSGPRPDSRSGSGPRPAGRTGSGFGASSRPGSRPGSRPPANRGGSNRGPRPGGGRPSGPPRGGNRGGSGPKRRP